MGKKDTVTKRFMNQPDIFADAFNCAIFGGKQRIRPERLHPLDTAAAGVPYGADGAVLPVQRQRDNLKYLAAMEDGLAIYMALGIENQTKVQYAMPVKAMLYDALYYMSQVEEAARSHRRQQTGPQEKERNPGEFLSGFYRDDRLIPVVTLVVSFTPDNWDAPLSLHEMFLSAAKEEGILSFVPDYRINLLSPAQMQEEEFSRLKSSLREVLLFIKYSQDRERLWEVIQKDADFCRMDWEAVNVINVVTGAKLKMGQDGEACDMCKAIQEMVQLGREEGIEQGMEQGMEQCIGMFIRNYLKEGNPREALPERLQKSFSLPEGLVEAYIKKYA